MLDLGASINVMPTSIYKSLKFGDLEPIGMTIQLVNRSVVQHLGVLEDVLVQVNELIFPADFYVLDMEDEPFEKGSTLILGRSFLMTARTKINVHAVTLSMEFGDHLVQFNIFEAMKHPTKDHSLFGIYLIDELVEEYFAGDTEAFDCLRSIIDEADYDNLWEVHNLSNSEDDITNLANLVPKEELLDLLDQVCKHEDLEYLNNAGVQVARIEKQLSTQPLRSHLKYAYLDTKQHLLVIITNNLHRDQEHKLLHVLRQPKKENGWKLSDLPGINPSICMHRILMEEEARPIRQQKRRLNPTILDVVKKEVTKLLAAGIIYPISDNQWVVPKKSRMTVVKNQHDELVPMRIQNNWQVCIDYRRLNQATRKDHFPFPFIDQVFEKLVGKSHYYFLDGFSRYMQIHIAP
ncbi:hypothetical protein CR513_36633, partial [Mucuna pruriens]